MRADRLECYLITMARLLSLLLVFALVLTNGAVVPAALCQHADAQAHAAALQSSDVGAASAALAEETAAVESSKKNSLAQAAAVQLAGFMLPADPALPLPAGHESSATHATEPIALSSLTINPLLEPPLA